MVMLSFQREKQKKGTKFGVFCRGLTIPIQESWVCTIDEKLGVSRHRPGTTQHKNKILTITITDTVLQPETWVKPLCSRNFGDEENFTVPDMET